MSEIQTLFDRVLPADFTYDDIFVDIKEGVRDIIAFKDGGKARSDSNRNAANGSQDESDAEDASEQNEGENAREENRQEMVLEYVAEQCI